MRRILRRCAAAAALIATLAVPISAFADDPLIQPPNPHAAAPATQATFWQIVRIVLFNA
ncbi:MAG TPA: hypothetical protein VG323_15930 [Thermoanaerobaculia bacterium]|nr:hypothetical protein [Thermoanaerobaculia bacterium]